MATHPSRHPAKKFVAELNTPPVFFILTFMHKLITFTPNCTCLLFLRSRLYQVERCWASLGRKPIPNGQVEAGHCDSDYRATVYRIAISYWLLVTRMSDAMAVDLHFTTNR
jgi:hypothetical protein